MSHPSQHRHQSLPHAIHSRKRTIVDGAYHDYLQGDRRAHLRPQSFATGLLGLAAGAVLGATLAHGVPRRMRQYEHLFSPEEFDRFPEIKRVFYSPYSSEVFFLPLEAFDFSLERDRILFAIMISQLALKAPGSREFAIANAFLLANPFLRAYVDEL